MCVCECVCVRMCAGACACARLRASVCVCVCVCVCLCVYMCVSHHLSNHSPHVGFQKWRRDQLIYIIDIAMHRALFSNGVIKLSISKKQPNDP